jgi:hypothetical protein
MIRWLMDVELDRILQGNDRGEIYVVSWNFPGGVEELRGKLQSV